MSTDIQSHEAAERVSSMKNARVVISLTIGFFLVGCGNVDRLASELKRARLEIASVTKENTELAGKVKKLESEIKIANDKLFDRGKLSTKIEPRTVRNSTDSIDNIRVEQEAQKMCSTLYSVAKDRAIAKAEDDCLIFKPLNFDSNSDFSLLRGATKEEAADCVRRAIAAPDWLMELSASD